MRCVWNRLINLLNPHDNHALLKWFEDRKPGVVAALRQLGITYLELTSIGISRLRLQVPRKAPHGLEERDPLRPCHKPQCRSHINVAGFVTWKEAREAGVPEGALSDFDVSFADDGGDDELCIILEWLPECLSAEELVAQIDGQHG